MQLTKKRLVIIVSAAVAIALLGVYLILFRPLINKLELLHREYRGLETSVSQARDVISSLNRQGLRKELVSQADVSSAIEELTRDGKAEGINFISLTPRQIESRQTSCRALPIEIVFEASYTALSDFLGKLDDFNRSVVCVRRLNMVLSKANPKNFTVRLSLDMYILE